MLVDAPNRIRLSALDCQLPQAFIALMSKEEIQADLPHRFAMLEDSRVIPMIEQSLG